MDRITVGDDKDFIKIQERVKKFTQDYVLSHPNISKEKMKKEMGKFCFDLIGLSMEKDRYRARTFTICDIPNNNHTRGACQYFDPNEKDGTIIRLNLDLFYDNGFNSKDTISRMESMTSMMETVFHEFRHYKQYRAAFEGEHKEIFSMEELYKISGEIAATSFNRDLTYKYGNNYKNWFIEADARQAGKNESIIASKLAYLEIYKKYPQAVERDMIKRGIAREVDGTVVGKKLDFFGLYGNRNHVITNAARYNISKYPGITSDLPMLGVIYNKDGTPKTMEEILDFENRFLERQDKTKAEKEQFKDAFDRMKVDRLLYIYSKEEVIEMSKRLGKEKMNSLFNDVSGIINKDYETSIEELDSLCVDSEQIYDSCEYRPSALYYKEIEKRKNEISESYISGKNKFDKIVERTRNVTFYSKREEIRNSINLEKKEEKRFTSLFGRRQFFINSGFKIAKKMGLTKKIEQEKTINMDDMIEKRFIPITLDDNVVDNEDIDLNSMLERVNELNSSIRQKEDMTIVMKASKDEARDIISNRNKKIEDKQIGE